MKQFDGYDKAKAAAQLSEKLPEGAYICKILNVEYKTTDNPEWSDRIELCFDIAEGEQKDFFRKQYQTNTSEDKKWKGKVSINVPKDDGSERDGWTKNAFARWPDALEKSNIGYIWDWDESKWKNKMVGIVFGITGTVINGKEVTYTEARFPVPVDTVKNGKAPKAKFKAKNGYTGNGVAASAPASSSREEWMQVSGNEEELPFA